MALAATIIAKNSIFRRNDSHPVTPVSVCSHWFEAIADGGMDAAQNSGNRITNPGTQITASEFAIIQLSDLVSRTGMVGTLLRVRMRYDDGITSSTDPVINVFGRTVSTQAAAATAAPSYAAVDQWQILENKNGNYDVTITTNEATDTTDGTDLWTLPDADEHTWDLDGCNEIIIGIKTALAVSAGSAALASLEARII